MKTLPYKAILGEDRSPKFKKISSDVFIVKLSSGGQYSLRKTDYGMEIWQVRDECHNEIGYGVTLAQAARVVLKDYCSKYYDVNQLNDPNLICLSIQYGSIIRNCIEREVLVKDMNFKTQRAMIHAYKKLNLFADDMTSEQILKSIDHRIETGIHCNQTDNRHRNDYEEENMQEIEE
jgi:hypothetical protein